MKYEKIHAYRNDCCLFRKELSDANVCPSCGMSRWKIPKNLKKEVKNVPVKVMWYFSPIPRFERMFRSKETSKLLTWHDRKREVNDLLQHPKDALSWKKIDNLWPEFGSEPRNLRLALSTDGVNPHGDLSSRYSCWPVMLVTYNLPPWLCMKRKFLMLTALISGPKQPGNEIDVYLAPLVDDLKILWHDGVECYDAYQDQCFRLKAILLWTINDFPAYGNLCGCTVKGYHACPICGEKTSSIYLPKGRKMAYIGHRKFLPRHHPYRKQKKVFNGAQELELTPEPLSGEEIFIQTNVMHIEKNVCANLIGTLLDIPVHLVREIEFCGPVHLRWMYPFERYMKVLKTYVRNRNRPEGCMVENYIVEEAIEFCSEFIAGVSSIGLNSSVIKKNSNMDRALSASSFIRPSKEQLDQAHLYVIQNVNDVLPYVEQHMESLRKLNSGKARSKKWIQEEHNRSFSRWLSTRVALALEVPKNSITPSLRWIAHGPSPDVATYSGYIINGYYYHTKRRDDIRRVQNSGVSITATTMQVSSSKDKNPVMSDMTFYGVIREIWEIDYHQLSFILFKCDWVDNRSGVKVDELGFTIVDLKRIGHKSDSFILATQAKQVFYVQDSANPEWSVVLTSPQRTIEEDFFEDEIGDMLQECGYETIKRMPNVDTPNETDDTNSTYIRHDCEGRWVEKVRNITAIFMMEDSSEDEREMLPEVRKKSFVPRGPTTMSELALVRNSGQKLPIQFNEHGQPVGATSKKMQSYIGVCVRQQIPITYNSWKEVPNELKDKIYDCISMSFDLQPNAKHSILMSASRKFRTFKTTLTQKYILPSKDQPSLLQFPPKIYSHINQEDWESFVDARLSEEWEDYSRIQRERRSKCVYNHHMSRKGYANLADELKITHDVSYRSTLWKEARKGKNNDYFDDATRDFATNKNEDILTDALGSKEHGGRVRGVGAFVSQSQYFNTVKGKEKMCHKEEDDSRCKSDKKRSNHSRSSIGSINIDLDADEDTPTNKGVEGTPCQLSIGSINNIVAVATIVEDNIGCPNVKVLVDVVTGENLTIPNPVKGKIETLNQALGNIIEWPRRLEHSTRKDVVYPSNYTDVNGIIKLLNRHAMNNMEDVDMIRIPMNELIFGSDKFVYLAREDLLHYCGMVEIGYMCILAYITCLWDKCDCAKNFFVIDQSKISSHIKDRDLRSRNLANQLEAVNLEQKVLIPYNTGFHWMLHVIDLRENCVYVLDSLRSKVNEDIHGIINVGLKTWQAKHDLQRYRSTPKWRPVKCPRQLDSVGCGYYVQKYIHEIVHNSSTSITNLFNTKNAYRQEEIDEIRTEWAAFVSRFV
ncbi:transposase [Cucumis melo var. makuwa]|uniref:Transposase n=1 Tax=Cucumis melo var. makuwa TaxID=1194695 RepID=A0A5A7UYV5_CUCMM|nr:transposase [Cucumis melo var. makuwa]